MISDIIMRLKHPLMALAFGLSFDIVMTLIGLYYTDGLESDSLYNWISPHWLLGVVAVITLSIATILIVYLLSLFNDITKHKTFAYYFTDFVGVLFYIAGAAHIYGGLTWIIY